MHLIGADGRVALVGLGAACRHRHNGGQRTHDARCVRSQLRRESERVGLALHGAVCEEQLELVAVARHQVRRKHFPHAAFAPQPQHVTPRIPLVEVAHHRNAARVRRPHGESHAAYAVDLAQVRTELFIGPQMRALGQ